MRPPTRWRTCFKHTVGMGILRPPSWRLHFLPTHRRGVPHLGLMPPSSAMAQLAANITCSMYRRGVPLWASCRQVPHCRSWESPSHIAFTFDAACRMISAKLCFATLLLRPSWLASFAVDLLADERKLPCTFSRFHKPLSAYASHKRLRTAATRLVALPLSLKIVAFVEDE